MITLIEMPALSSTMKRGKVVKWYKREGDFVEKGEPLFEVETDKVNVEVESLASGFLRKILLEEGIQVPTNTPIAIIAESMDEDISSVIEAKPSISVSPGDSYGWIIAAKGTVDCDVDGTPGMWYGYAGTGKGIAYAHTDSSLQSALNTLCNTI